MQSLSHGKQDVHENGPRVKSIGTVLCCELKMHVLKRTAEGFIYHFPILWLPISLIEIDPMFSISGLYKLKRRNKLEMIVDSY